MRATLKAWEPHLNHALTVTFENDVCMRVRCETCKIDLPREGVAFTRVRDEPSEVADGPLP